MSKKKIEVAWTIYRLRKTPAEYVGRVYARERLIAQRA